MRALIGHTTGCSVTFWGIFSYENEVDMKFFSSKAFYLSSNSKEKSETKESVKKCNNVEDSGFVHSLRIRSK